MKKIILIAILPITIMMAGSFVMTEGNPLIKADTVSTSPTKPSSPTDTTTSNWTPKPLPTQKFNVLDYGLKGDGVTDDSAALKSLAKNSNVTNWYFPAGYRFNLSEVGVPATVTSIHGGGTIHTLNPGSSGFGALKILGKILIDGITFTVGSDFAGIRNYGMVTFMRSVGAGSDGSEIRNCTFDWEGNNGQIDGIVFFVSDDSTAVQLKNLRIYNNDFLTIATGDGFAIEGHDYGSRAGFINVENMRIYNNNFNGTGNAISTPQIRAPHYIYDNTFDGNNWAIELPECDKVEVYGNTFKNITKNFIIEGVIWGNAHNQVLGTNKYYNNNFYGGAYLAFEPAGTRSEVYDNYIEGIIYVKRSSDIVADTGLGSIHDNIIVTKVNGPKNWVTASIAYLGNLDNAQGSINNNDIYNVNPGKTGIVSGAGPNSIMSNNHIYTDGGKCINEGTQTGGSCDIQYTDTPPNKI